MSVSPSKINIFTFFKLPLAWWAGVRVKNINEKSSIVQIKYKWINQNPFKSMFWAAQGMAAELSTGVLVMKGIQDSGKKVSMLVTNQKGNFTKKAIGKIRFECHNGDLVKNAIAKSNETGEGQIVILKSEGVNEEGLSVSNFEFEWSLKVKK